MTRKQALAACKYAGYHNDSGAFTRIFVENRIGRTIAHEHWQQGVNAKTNGVKCTCSDCQKEGK